MRNPPKVAQSEPRSPHIIDQLIEERATGLMRHPRVWRAVQRWLYPRLGHADAVAIVDRLGGASGREVFDWLSQRLAMQVSATGLEHVPAAGRAVVVANHPSGIADGIAVWDTLRRVRQDVVFLANRDAVRALPRLAEIIIPVEWRPDRRDHGRNRETVRALAAAFREERLVVIFPSGRLARPTPRGLVERPWMSAGIAMALRYGCPIVPMHLRGRNSALFYLLWFLNTELKDMTLFRELLNKGGARYEMTIAQPVAPRGEAEALTLALKDFVIQAMPRGARQFNPDAPLTGTP
ncbi:MAG: 1-acyl-sn-glycerol-3-phosphate acyltransferase, partial [Pseudomonadales bacterium]